MSFRRNTGPSPDTVPAGWGVSFSGARAADRSTADLSGREIAVEVDLHLGAGQATVLTTDLSHAYVEENSGYSS